MKKDIEFLRNNPVFWSRLGFCYDPPLKNEQGKPLVFCEDLNKYGEYHRDFSKAGVKIHTCILHIGWMGVDEYDYSLTDRVLDEVFKDNEDAYFIPRIKLNVPVNWCYENPEDVCVYYGGPTDTEEIKRIVGTEKHDYIGYNSPKGYYAAQEFEDKRPNVGGVIARQSFSSKKWLKDAGVALEKFIDRLENSKYADRIIGYHIAHGVSGEACFWGRFSTSKCDYSTNNKKAFYEWGLKKYKTRENLAKAWNQENISAETIVLPTPEEREGATQDFYAFMRGRKEDVICIDYDKFNSDINMDAIEHFGKIIKEKTGKLTGTFYGYFIHIGNAGYTGHLAMERILNSPYVDFIAAPKSYYRCAPGQPGGEMGPAQSVNLKKLWLDELDNRTFLNVMPNEKSVAKTPEETKSVFLREFSKNLSHNSGFWWMDLGGGWFNSPVLMEEFERMVSLNNELRKKNHKSVADVLIVIDERSCEYMRANNDLRSGFMQDFIDETTLSGAVADVYRTKDLETLDLSQYKLVIFAYTMYMETGEYEKIMKKIPADASIMYNYAPGIWNENGFDLQNVEKITGFAIEPTDENPNGYDFPQVKITKENPQENRILNVKPYMKHDEIREIAKKAGCHIYTETDNITIYGDNRFISFCNNEETDMTVKFKENGTYTELLSGKEYNWEEETTLHMPEKSVKMFIKK